MTSITVDITKDPRIDKINLDDGVQKTLVQAGVLIRSNAIQNAPVMTGTLRRSITTELREVRQGKVTVGSNLKYARRREYENKKNPSRKFYMKKALNSNKQKIYNLFLKNIEGVLKK